MAQVVEHHWNVATTPPEKKVRWPERGEFEQTAPNRKAGGMNTTVGCKF
jgi:hypothetical protein